MQKRRPGRQHKLSAFSLFHIEFNGVRPLFPQREWAVFYFKVLAGLVLTSAIVQK
ncbi:hypothetical protein VT98_14482, partial [Candidatus Electrothrix communis]